MTRGERVIAFIERYCLSPEGKHVGEPMRLMPFQKRFIRDVYDNPAGTRRGYLSIARKNGKTALIAAIALAHIVGPEARLNAQIVSGARSRDQAGQVFNYAAKMVRLSPELSKLIRIVPSQKKLIGLPLGVEYTAISAEAGTAHGGSPVLAILDEVGQVRGPVDGFVEAIETSQGAHDAPLLLAISTQAATDGDMFSMWLDDAEASKDPRIVSHVYSAPKECDLHDRDAWRAANPAMGEFRSIEDIEAFADQAARLPSKENSFRWLYLNQRIEANSPFLTRSEWEACKGPVDLADLEGAECYAGLDLSASRDLTAFVLAFPQPDGRVLVWPMTWLPGDGLRERSESERVPWDLWAREGHMHMIPGATIDPEVVAREIAEASGRFDLKAVAYDRWRINDLKRELDNIGADVPLVPFGQGFKDMAPAVDRTERMVAERKIVQPGNPVLNMCAANAIVVSDPAGNRKLAKHKSAGRIDALVALVMALGAMSAEVEDDRGSYLEERPLVFV